MMVEKFWLHTTYVMNIYEYKLRDLPQYCQFAARCASILSVKWGGAVWKVIKKMVTEKVEIIRPIKLFIENRSLL